MSLNSFDLERGSQRAVGITMAPSVFGDFSNDLLVGNFGDGRMRSGGPFVDPNRVYFTAGINHEANGLFGAIAATPKPGTLTMMGIATLAAAVAMRRRRAR